MEIGLSGLPEKAQSLVDRWNENWRSLQREREQVDTMRVSILDGIESGSPGDLVAKAAALEGRIFGLHQKLVASLRSRDEILSECQAAQQAVVEDFEKALAKAERAAEAGLKKIGFDPESDPRFDANAEAARNRLRVKVREAAPVRVARGERNDAENRLNQIIEARRADRQILQNGIDELTAVARRLLRV